MFLFKKLFNVFVGVRLRVCISGSRVQIIPGNVRGLLNIAGEILPVLVLGSGLGWWSSYCRGAWIYCVTGCFHVALVWGWEHIASVMDWCHLQ